MAPGCSTSTATTAATSSTSTSRRTWLSSRTFETRTVLGRDDVASQPKERKTDRRGVAGILFAYKAAGAAAERGDDLEHVAAVAEDVVEHTATMGIGLSPTILPTTGAASFDLPDGQMEIGIGIHGEPGIHRGDLDTADEIADRIVNALIADLELKSGDRVAALVNGLGATPLEELYILYRRTHQVLNDLGVEIHRRATSASTPPVSKWPALQSLSSRSTTSGWPCSTRPRRRRSSRRPERVNADELKDRIRDSLAELVKYADELRDLDQALGDGDLGITVTLGAEAVIEAVTALPDSATVAQIARECAKAFANANPSTMAALVAGGLLAGSKTWADVTDITVPDAASFIRAGGDNIAARGKTQLGDKTILDAIMPAADALDDASDGTSGLGRRDRRRRTCRHRNNGLAISPRSGFVASRAQHRVTGSWRHCIPALPRVVARCRRDD